MFTLHLPSTGYASKRMGVAPLQPLLQQTFLIRVAVELYSGLSSSRLGCRALQPLQPLQALQLYSSTSSTLYSTLHQASARLGLGEE